MQQKKQNLSGDIKQLSKKWYNDVNHRLSIEYKKKRSERDFSWIPDIFSEIVFMKRTEDERKQLVRTILDVFHTWIKRHPIFMKRLREEIQFFQRHLTYGRNKPDQKNREKFFREVFLWFNSLFYRPYKINTQQQILKQLKFECHNDTDLTGDDWSTIAYKDIFIFTDKDEKNYCFNVNEMFKYLHGLFTEKVDHLNPPKNPYKNELLTEDFFQKFLKHIKKHKQVPSILDEPEVVYFLKNNSKYYRNLPTNNQYDMRTYTREFLTGVDARNFMEAYQNNDGVNWVWKGYPADVTNNRVYSMIHQGR